MLGNRAPKAPEEPEVAAAAAVTARSVSAPPIAANSNTGRVPAPRPPQLKETQRLGYLLRDRKQSYKAGVRSHLCPATQPTDCAAKDLCPLSVILHENLKSTG